MPIKKELSLPKLLGVQADGAAPIVYDRVFENPETVATAIRIGNPASWDLAKNALDGIRRNNPCCDGRRNFGSISAYCF